YSAVSITVSGVIEAHGGGGGRGIRCGNSSTAGENGPSLGNGGGGGGGGGRIVFAYQTTLVEGTTSPSSFSFTF
ncbi:MAG: hypothetical protein K8M05_12410, partial [Deltaproteobacteria bacterium]|nr:hypothetical protein [Kofleriaceae bacterium]